MWLRNILLALLFIVPISVGAQGIVRCSPAYNKVQTSGGGGYSIVNDEYQTVYDDFTTKPVDSIASFGDTCLVGGIKSVLGSFDNVAILHIYAAHTNNNSEALQDWSGNGYDGTLDGTPAFVALNGITGSNDGNDHIHTAFNPLTHGFHIDSVTVFGYIQHDLGANSGPLCGNAVDAPPYLHVYPELSGSGMFGRIFSGSSTYQANTTGNGFFIWTVRSQTDYEFYRAGTSLGSGDPPVIEVPDDNIYVLWDQGDRKSVV